MRGLGCLALIAVLALAAVEAWSFVIASRLLRTHAADLIGGSGWVDTVLPIIIAQVVLIVIGVVAVRRAINRLPNALMGTMMGQGSDAGRVAMQFAGGLMLIIPGFFLDVAGLLLLLPPVQALFAGLGQKILMAMVRQQMAKMFPGGRPPPGFPGAMGGMGGMPAGFPFPGMRPRGPLAPDERIPKGPPKVIDTTAERVDRP